MSKETILVVEDDRAIRVGLELNLKLEGYQVICAVDTESGLAIARERSPDLVVLDLMLPDGSGLDLLATLRREEKEMQVLILTARGLEEDKLRGLELGADDYMTKPFSLKELLARIDAALRRERIARAKRKKTTLAFGDVRIDPHRRRVHCAGEEIKLTRREYDILLCFVEHPDRIYERETLLHRFWGADYEGTSRTVDNFISSLRRKIEIDPANPRHLITVHGVGYRFQK